MTVQFPSSAKKLIIYSGNILNLNEIRKKVGQTLTDELVETVRATLKEWQCHKQQGAPLTSETVQVRRSPECASFLVDVNEERKDLKIGLKLYLPVSSPTSHAISDAVTSLLTELNTSHVESLVLAQAGRLSEGVTAEQQLERMSFLWSQLEAEIRDGRVLSGGVSDLDTEPFINLYSEAKVKPSIVQINLASCCVVPPALQAFAKENEVQLLTHNDPVDALPEGLISEAVGEGWKMSWILKSQVHVKCRGVLASKGYIVCLHRDNAEN